MLVVRPLIRAAVALSLAAPLAFAQKTPKPKDSAKIAKDSMKLAKATKDSGSMGRFFRSEEPVVFTLTTNIKRIKGDKDDNPPWRAAKISYAATAPDTGTITIPVRIKTRGIWRRKNCEFPPIWLNFDNTAKKTIFGGLDQVKLANYCRNNDESESYILRELQVNRALRLLTPYAHSVRLARVTYVDSASGKKETTRYAMLQEEPTALAGRLNGKIMKATGAVADDLDPMQSGIVGVFNYMIGNTDFSIPALHNIELVASNNALAVYPITHDFDFSGAVNPRYATVDPRLKIRTVRDRLFRGDCIPPETYTKVFALFNAKKDSIYGLYKDPVGKLLADDVTRETLKYFDDFYKTINNPKAAKEEILDAECLGGKRAR